MSDSSSPLIAGGGRKYTIALLVIVALVLARACAWIDGAQLMDGLKSVLLLYGGANVGQKAIDKLAELVAAKLGKPAAIAA